MGTRIEVKTRIKERTGHVDRGEDRTGHMDRGEDRTHGCTDREEDTWVNGHILYMDT